MKAGLAIWGWGVRRPKYFTIFSIHLLGFFREILEYYCDVIMGTMASQITSLTIIYSTVHSGAHQRKHQSPASLAGNSLHKWPLMRKMFPFDDVIMCQGNLREFSGTKLCQSVGTLLVFHLVQFYVAGTVWSLLKLVSHIYSNKPTCC